MSEDKIPIISEATRISLGFVIVLIAAAIAYGALTQKVAGIDEKVGLIQGDINIIQAALLNKDTNLSVK